MKVCYARVSSREQALNSNALIQQLDRLNSQVIDKVYSDVGSGRTSKRLAFKELIKDIKKGLISELVVTRMDRLMRSLMAQIEFVLLLEKENIILTVLDQAVDFKTASGKLQLNILGAFSQNFSDDLSEKVKHGYEYYRKTKKTTRSILGYKIVNSQILIDDDPFLCLWQNKSEYSKYKIARKVIDFYLEEKSISGCLKRLNIYFGLQKSNFNPRAYKSLHFSEAGIKCFLTHPILRGYLVYFQYDKNNPTQLYPNNHQPILSELEYAEILRILDHNKKVGGYGSKSKNPFTGFISCQTCLSSMRSLKIKQNPFKYYSYFRCQNARQQACSNYKSVRVDKIKAILFQTLQSKYLELINLTTAIIPTDSIEIQSLLSQINSLSSLPNNPAIDQAIANIQLQIQNLQSEHSKNKLMHSDNEDYLKSIFSSTSFWETLLPHQLKEIVQKLVNKILIFDGEVIAVKLNL
jgi:DNA invertase Pin-like site-specific DNA recombinase